MPPRLPLTPSRVSQACVPPIFGHHAGPASASAYGRGLLFDLLTPALKFRARHASAHAMQQKVVDDAEGVYVAGAEVGGVGGVGNAEAGPSRWMRRARREEGCSAEDGDKEAGAKRAELGGESQERNMGGIWSVKGKERSWLAIPPRPTTHTSPRTLGTQSQPPDRSRPKRPLYPSPTEAKHPSNNHTTSDRLCDISPRHPPHPLMLIERYRHSPASRAYGELLARYARRMDNVKAETVVKDIMGRARTAPVGYVRGVKRTRRPLARYEQPPDPEEAQMMVHGVLERLENQVLGTQGGLSLQEVIVDSEVVRREGSEGGSDRTAGHVQTNHQEVDLEQRTETITKQRQSKRRARKEKKLEVTTAELFTPDDPPHMIGEEAPTEPIAPPPKHPKRPDRRRTSRSLIPNIRASVAWPALSTPRSSVTPTHVLQCLHHRLLHPFRYPERLSLDNALDLMRLVPTYRPSNLLDVLHLYLAYSRYPASIHLARVYEAYFRLGMPTFPYERPELGALVIGSMRKGWTAQTLHLCTLSIMRSHVAPAEKHDALRALVHDAEKRGLQPGSEIIRHLVRFCMAVDDRTWCRQLLDMWWTAHALRGLSVSASKIDLSSPATLQNTGDERDPTAYDHVPFRFAQKGRQMQRWFRTLRRLERKGWVRRVGVIENVADRRVKGVREWRGGYVWQGRADVDNTS